MRNKTFIFLLVSIILVLIKSILVNTYNLIFILLSFVVGLIIIYYSWSKGLKFLYGDFKKWFNNNVSFLGVFLAFLLFFLPLSSADKCLDSENEIFAGSLINNCIEYNPEYKEKYTYINIFSYVIYLFIALYFSLLGKPKNIIEEKKEPEKVLKVEKKDNPNKKKKISKTKKSKIKRNKSKRRKNKK